MPKITNTQNVPRDKFVKNLIVPLRPGEVLLEGDQSQAEARIVAYKAEETTLIKLFDEGKKVHEYVGTLMFQKPVSKKETSKEYDVAKVIAHMSNYGGSYLKIAQVILDDLGIVVPTTECKKRQNIYYQQFPRIRSVYQAEIKQELLNNLRRIKTPIGFGGWERKFFMPKGDELFRAAYAHYAQNPVAFITNLGLIRLTEWGWGDYIYMQCHDAIVMSVPEQRLKQAAVILQKALTYPLEIKGRTLVIPIELKAGKRWGEMEDVHV